MSSSKKTTNIGSSVFDTEKTRMRGKDAIREVVGKLSFSQAFFFIVTGRTLSEKETVCFDACLTALMDHGLTPTALVARLVHDSVPSDLQVSVAASILLVGNKHVGTMVGMAELLNAGVASGLSASEWATGVDTRYRSEERRIPGLGHELKKDHDARAERLVEIARDNDIYGDYFKFLDALTEAAAAGRTKAPILNVTGAIAAILCELHFPPALVRSVAILGRAAGSVAHIHEEGANHISDAVLKYVNSEFEYQD